MIIHSNNIRCITGVRLQVTKLQTETCIYINQKKNEILIFLARRKNEKFL